METESAPDPFDVFVTSMSDDDVQVQIDTIQKLQAIAISLDVERTQTQLMPFLHKLTDEAFFTDDELLLNIAEQLGEFLPLIGGYQNSQEVLSILERIATIDEKLVRGAAVNSFKKIISAMDSEAVETTIIPIIFKLVDSDWFTSKISAAQLIPECYKKVSEKTKDLLKNLQKVLNQDDSPFVRRTAASNLSVLADHLDVSYLKFNFLPVFENMSTDDEEIVRFESIDVGIILAQRLEESDVEQNIMPIFLRLLADQSWRVRQYATKRLVELTEAVGSTMAKKYIVDVYQNTATDSQPEVRLSCAQNIIPFCTVLQKFYDKNDEIDPVITEKMIPIILKIYTDFNSGIRDSITATISGMCTLLGKEKTKQYLFPMIIDALENTSENDKENIVTNLNNVVNTIGLNENETIERIFNIINNNIGSPSTQWRTRKNFLLTIDFLAAATTVDIFDEKLKPLLFKFLNDVVYAIRRLTPTIMPRLIKSFGFNWTKKSLVPEIVRLAEDTHYLFRQVSLFCMSEILVPSLSNKSEKYLDSFSSAQEDKTTVEKLKLFKKLNTSLLIDLQQQWVKDAVKYFLENEINDDNIKTYAETTFDSYQNLDIWKENINEENDKIYILSVLKLADEIFLKVLRKLSKDKTMNIRNKVGSILVKIRNLCNSLEEELSQEWVEVLLQEHRKPLVASLLKETISLEPTQVVTNTSSTTTRDQEQTIPETTAATEKETVNKNEQLETKDTQNIETNIITDENKEKNVQIENADQV